MSQLGRVQRVKRPCLRDLRREETLARIEWMRAEAEESRERISYMRVKKRYYEMQIQQAPCHQAGVRDCVLV